MPLTLSGQLSLLRVHERGSGFGPASDFIDVEVVVQFVGRPADAFGFQLRSDANLPARQGMLDLLRSAFNRGWIANIDHETPPGKHNGIIVRVWLTKPVGHGGVVGGVGGGVIGAVGDLGGAGGGNVLTS
ncbi:MAG: hypothetical protein E6H74_13780 [Betaproteobacteria bacterium]|jgi:hypothetical protein|nr:MAG: hypothetical protein E6H74_13780 [Betaproteobacteria bacterium]